MRTLRHFAMLLVACGACGGRSLEDIPGYNVPRVTGGTSGETPPVGGTAATAGHDPLGGTAGASAAGFPALGGRSGASGTSGETSGGSSGELAGGTNGAVAGSGAEAGTHGGPVCAGAVTGDRFDPERVYLAGTLASGSCGRDAIVVPECPNSAAVGFDCEFSASSSSGQPVQIRATDGRLLYDRWASGEVREFHCDGCPYLDASANAYPKRPLDNDPILASPCAGALASQFLLDPAGQLLVRCNGRWMDEAGRVVHSAADSTLAHLGYDRLALTRDPVDNELLHSVVDLATGEVAPITGLPPARAITFRARAPDRFLVVLVLEERKEGEQAATELWEVDRTGEATRRGAYPPFPTEIGPRPGAKLLPDGVLYQIGNGPRAITDVVVRRTLGGSTEVVYSEANDPHVEIHISGLVTGP